MDNPIKIQEMGVTSKRNYGIKPCNSSHHKESMQIMTSYSQWPIKNQENGVKIFFFKMCNSSHYGELMQVMHLKPINSPRAHQKPIKGGHFHHSKVCVKNSTQFLHRCCDAPTTISLLLKKLCSDHHCKVIEDPWGATSHGPLLLSLWLRHGFLSCLLIFLLDI